MATDDNFIVAIELGSSKVTALAGRKQPDGAIQVLACAQEPSDTFIRKGRINNVNKMTQCITNIKERLEKKLQKSISRVYVGIGGMGMHTVANTVTRCFHEKTIVSAEIVAEIANTNHQASSPEREILEAVPQEFKLGTQFQIDPVGIPTESIEGRYLNIVANSTVREGITHCFHAAGVNIADMPITVLRLADSMLTESEKRSGCVFVDMGAETTSVAVFKNNLLRHLAVIPLGGANINRDIASLQIDDKEAERLKLKYGSAAYADPDEEAAPIQLEDGRQVKYEELCGLIEARMEEIILNVSNQITLSKYDPSQLIAGIIVTGGAAQIKDIDKAIEELTGFTKKRFLNKSRLQTRTGINDFNRDGSYNAALAIIDEANLNCCGGDIGDNTNDIFQAEEKRRQEEEKIRLAAEQAAEQAKNNENNSQNTDSEEEEEEIKKPKKKSGFRKFLNRFMDLAQNMVSEEDNLTSNNKKETEKGE